MSPPVRVLLVDDHEVVRAGFRRLLETEADIEVSAEAGDGPEAYRLYPEVSPDVTVMDLELPGQSGIEASRRILARDPKARILVFSIHETGAYLERVLDLGILGYVSKRSAPEVLAEAVRRVARGERYLGPELRRYAEGSPDDGGKAAIATLSSREFEVFRLLAEGLTVPRVAEMLHLSPKTVGNHYTQVKKKLGAANAAELTLIAVRAGVITL